MIKKIELLAPGGDVDSIKAAILAGADAIYCGLDKFNARNRAANISFDDLLGILRFAHKNNCQVFLTLNIIIVENEIPALIRLLNKLINTSIDGIIIQDLGMFYLLSKHFKQLKIHASTQLTTHNEGQIKFLSKLKATRVNLSRELNIDEIKTITKVAHENDVLTEVFVHGSYCISFSGICYMSSVHGGNSGNRGRCSQPCRDQYVTTEAGKDFPLNLKDNSAYFDLKELAEAGVDSLKIEGRIKKFHYVYTVVKSYKEQLQRIYTNTKISTNNSDLYKVFNRGFSNSFLKGSIHKDMFIDNPRDNSAIHLAQKNGDTSHENLEKAKGFIYDERTEIINSVKNEIDLISIEKAPLTLFVSGKIGTPLKVIVKTPDSSFDVLSAVNLVPVGTKSKFNSIPEQNKKNTSESLNYESLIKRLKAINDTEYFIQLLELENLEPNLYIPFKELTAIKIKILYILNQSRESVDPITIPALNTVTHSNIKPTLSVLIDAENDLHLCNETNVDIYYQLPNSFKNTLSKYIELFTKNKKLTPWFPSVLIGDDYSAAIEFLTHVKPKCIVTDNTGIAFEAYEKGIAWIAGPHLNIVNSYGLICLKEEFNCAGAFVSNEINRQQIKGIKKPDNFKLYYGIYHPVVLMTSRQCLFQQVNGCEKNKIDKTCISTCEKQSTLTNLKKENFVIEKSKGNYHRVYNAANFLNLDIINDVPDVFSSFFIDLRNIRTETKIEVDKLRWVELFENFINGNEEEEKEIKKAISHTTQEQYKKGI